MSNKHKVSALTQPPLNNEESDPKTSEYTMEESTDVAVLQ